MSKGILRLGTISAMDESTPAPPGGLGGDPKRREEILALLRESLAEWESRVDWEGLPERKRRALMELAKESASTLRALIANFESRSAGPEGV